MRLFVDAPAQARGKDEDAAKVECETPAGPREKNSAREDCRGTDEQAAVDVFTEDYPSDGHGRETLDVEQQRARGGRRHRQTQHQQKRSEQATEEEDAREPRQFGEAKRRFLVGQVQCLAPEQDEREADASTDIEDAGEEPWIGVAEEDFGDWSGRAEKDRRAEGQRYARPQRVSLG